jgi:hypothetical protein
MPRISKRKEEKIKEYILHFLFQASPKALFTAKIAQELARDEEYIKKLLIDLEIRNFVIAIKKNPQGKEYSRRIRWLLHSNVYEAYKKINNNKQGFSIDSRGL